MAYKINIYDYSIDGIDYCIGSGTLSLIELGWELERAQGQDIDVHISSIGGSAFEAIGMYDALKKYPGKVTTYIDSLAASAASIIAMGGQIVVMSKYAMLMIHKPAVGSGGNADQLQSDINMLDIVQSRLAGIYMDKTGLAEDVINELINATTWMTAEQAKDLGFIDQIEDYSGADVTNLSSMINFANHSAPAVYKRVLNKLKIAQNEISMNTDKELIQKTTTVLERVMNFFKSVTTKTVTNKAPFNHIGPLAIGSKVTNEDGSDVDDDEYTVDNAGKKVKATVKNSYVTNMEDDDADVTNAADTEEEKEVANVLNSVGLKVINKVEAAGFAKVITNHLATINTQNTLITELRDQLKVTNELVIRDETKIKEDIKSEFIPDGSKRSDTTVTNSANDMFKPTTAIAQAAVKRAMNKAPGIVK